MSKSVEYYLGLPYTIELHQDAEEGWFVRVKELPGCMSQGDTADDALASIREAMPLWIESALASGYEIPEPRTEEEYSGKFVVRVPRSLHRELVQGAVSEGVSLNQFINVVLSKAVGGSLHSAQAGAQAAAAGARPVPPEPPAARASDRRSPRQPVGAPAPGIGA